MRRSAARIRAPAAVGILALVGLLAAGLGVLGGRPEELASPRPSLVGAVDTAAPTAPPPTQRGDCIGDPVSLPVVNLRTEQQARAGAVELMPAGAPVASAPIDDGLGAAPVVVRPDDVVELAIEGDVCPVDWEVLVIDRVLGESFIIPPDINEGRQSQLSIEVSRGLAAVHGLAHNVRLAALLVYPTVVARVAWEVDVLPLDRPMPHLLTGVPGTDGTEPPEILVVPGCDVTVTLGNGYVERMPDACDGDLSAHPGEPARLGPGTPLAFYLDGWSITDLNVICGGSSGLSFVAEPMPGCQLDIPMERPFIVPAAAGRWTLAIAACAVGSTRFAPNRVCGTWYANVETP